MSQEHHVLKCFSCETFQAHIVKKSRKWECKVCGAKQSLKRNYGRGSAKDCRIHVMKLNELRLTMGNASDQTEGESFEKSTNNFEKQEVKETMKGKEVLKSKWDKYLEDSGNDSKSDTDDAVSDLFLETEKKKKRVKKQTKECYQKPKRFCLESGMGEVFSEPCKEIASLSSSVEKKFHDSEESAIRIKNKLKNSKYAKYVDEEEEKDELVQQDKRLNIFGSEPTDLDTVLSFE